VTVDLAGQTQVNASVKKAATAEPIDQDDISLVPFGLAK
jgi:hypothetical protein